MKYDAIVIGSGQGGNPLAQKLATDGRRVAIIESGLLGGTCVNVGCTPTKAMVASAQVAHYARNAERWGVRAGDVSIDLPQVLARKNKIVESSRKGWEKKFEGKENPRLIHGRARFTGHKTIEVNGETLEGERVFIDTGTRPSVPPITGIESADFLTSTTILDLQEIPEHLVILGGGYVGLEFSQMFRRFGSEVTVIQSAPHILPNEDEDITRELQKYLESEGIRFHLNAQATAVSRGTGTISVSVEGKDKVTGSHLLVATGRVPNTEDLDLDKAGVKVNEKGFIVVDEFLKTTADEVWAIGDVNGGPQFTHISYNDFQILYANLYEGKELSTASRILPYAVFTDPTLGRVGLTEKAARAKGHRLKIGKIPMTWVARARSNAEKPQAV